MILLCHRCRLRGLGEVNKFGVPLCFKCRKSIEVAYAKLPDFAKKNLDRIAGAMEKMTPEQCKEVKKVIKSKAEELKKHDKL